MMENRVILIVDASATDIFLMRRVLDRSGHPFVVLDVPNAVIAKQYLAGEGKYSDRNKYPVPNLVLCEVQRLKSEEFCLLNWIRAERAFDRMQVALLVDDQVLGQNELIHSRGACACIDKGNFVFDSEPFVEMVESCFAHGPMAIAA